jgi:multidrug efflux pump subunit AcrA (membrane-fusion protein)
MIGRTSEQVSSASQSEPGEDEVRRAKQEIQSLFQEVVELSRSEVDEGEFYAALLDKAIAALAAIGGVVWTIEEGGPFTLQYQVNLQQTGLIASQAAQAQHAKLLGQIAKRGEPTLVAPQSGTAVDGESGDDAAANPTDYLLVVAPIRSDRGVDGLVEVFQRTGQRPTVQRGYLRFLVQLCEAAGEYLKTRRLRQFVTKQTLWEQLEGFTSSVHTKLDSRQTAYTIANEGRRLVGCDRVTVVLRKGSKYVVEAISGQDTFDKRSNTVRMLRELATVVGRSGEDLWYSGETENLSPQVEKAVNAYVDETHTKQIAVLPLREADPHADDKTKARKRENILGALVIEQLVDSRPPEGMLQRVDVVRRHSATALTNAQAHEGLFLLPLWRTIGKSRVLVTARNLPKTVTAGIVLAGIATFLSIYPWDFTVTANGKLLPEERRDVFAALNGMITEVPVRENQTVKRGDVLAVQRSSELEQKWVALQAQIAANLEETQTAHVALATANPSGQQDPVEIAGNLNRLREELAGLRKQEQLLRDEHERLRITSPIDGKVVTWRVEQRLKDRTVNQGTRIMEVADPTTAWELQIDVPEAKMGHIWRQLRALHEEDSNAELEVTFILATHVNPEDKLVGTIDPKDIQPSVEVGGETGNTVRMTVHFEQDELLKLIDDNSAGEGASAAAQANPEDAIAQLKQNLKVGADVKAKIHCGREPVGYVLFHEVWEFIQSRILFWF